MKTKLIAPWNLKAGMFIVLETVPRDIAKDGNPKAFEVRSICKFVSEFTGATAWRVTYNDKISPNGFHWITYHGKINNLPFEKVCIECKQDVKATVTPNGIKFKLVIA